MNGVEAGYQAWRILVAVAAFFMILFTMCLIYAVLC
jgi:hypothetical protein